MPYLPEGDDVVIPFFDAPLIVISDDEDDGSAVEHSGGPRKKRTHTQDTTSKVNELHINSLSQLSTPDRDQIPEADTIGQDGTNPDSLGTPSRKRGRLPLELDHVYMPGPAFPRSAFEGWVPPFRESNEYVAIDDLKLTFMSDESHAHHDYTFFALENFTIYRPPGGKHEGALVCLDRLLSHSNPRFMFDGELSVGDTRHFVRGVPFETLTVDGYFDFENVGAQGNICIQSIAGSRSDVWYKLGQPSKSYKRFHDPFLWLVQFTKHVMNFLAEYDAVELAHFRRHFHKWLTARYFDDGEKRNETVASWLLQVPYRDFRTAVNANVAFLYKECFGVDDQKMGLRQHPLWEQIDPQRLGAIPKQQPLENRTIVTPFAYDCFQRMYFGDQLEPRDIRAPALLMSIAGRKNRMRLTSHMPLQALKERRPTTARAGLNIAQPFSPAELKIATGDVVAVKPFGDGWGKSSSAEWYAYVQRTRLDERTQQTRLDVIWLYHPADTTLEKAYYPFNNELFLSDNCDCGADALHLDQVIGKIEISWFAKDPHTEENFFVRRKYRTVAEDDTYDFIDLHNSDFECRCTQRSSVYDEVREQYSIGEPILYKNRQRHLQVGQIIAFASEKVLIRCFVRKDTVDDKAQPNELMATDSQVEISPSACIRRCHVRYFEWNHIPTPYDRNGVGDYFFLKGSAHDRGTKFPPLKQGWNPTDPQPKRHLKGMGLFCGGGTFDRGLEEGGAVKFRYAIDYAERALHSYMANAEQHVHYFLGSVDDYIAQALAGRADPRIAQPGDFDILCAGSPCQGFSYLQIDRNSADSKRNASRIASVVSFVDFYSPKYLILENVLALTRVIGPKKDENVFTQLLAALVALGYQVQQFLMDSWLYSSSQSRSRVFVIASAPGLEPLDLPPVSHSHPPNMRFSAVALGASSNGKRFGIRHDHFTPFGHVSARQAVQDLPNIEDAQVQLCPQYPDHRTAAEESAVSRNRIAIVPVRPRNMGLMQLRHQQRLHGEALRWCERVNKIRQHERSKIYRRIHPEGLFGTIVTKLHPRDGINGTVVHWDQHRVITVMEARRAQGFPDHEVIVGTPAQQLEIIGNSVERNTALVLGLQLRDSWHSQSQDGAVGREESTSLHAARVIPDGQFASDMTRLWAVAEEDEDRSSEESLPFNDSSQTLRSLPSTTRFEAFHEQRPL